ncbi:Uncharacterised protein [Serratia plymuthica]|uniref:MmyB-like transcription regulator ligand binding domain-containing protein n=1 Tax=Serratia plymuthica TaxID=82996 RepID=A0A2X4U560_SERPL|nr:Uncharacterised protein [Serratia plymuthica]
MAFTHEHWRASQLDWDEVMPKMVALFRAQMAEHLGEPIWEAQLARYLAVSEDFRTLWRGMRCAASTTTSNAFAIR